MSVDGVALNTIFAGLKSPLEDERHHSAVELGSFLTIISRDLSQEQFLKYSSDINKMIFELLHSKETSEKLGGIAAINTLINFDSGSIKETVKIQRILGYLSTLIVSNELTIMRQATRTLGRLASPGGAIAGNIVDSQAKKAIEWLQTDGKSADTKRHAAILIIIALADNAPLLLFGYVPQILKVLWGALKDSKQIIREDAALTLEKSLAILNERDPAVRAYWIQNLAQHATEVLTEKVGDARIINSTSSSDAVYGGLLIYREVLRYSNDPFVVDKLKLMYEVCGLYKNHKLALVRQELTQVFPLLCRANPSVFSEKYLHPTIYYYLTQLRKLRSSYNDSANGEKATIFRSIGYISVDVGNHMVTYLDPILDNIREGLTFATNSNVQSILASAVESSESDSAPAPSALTTLPTSSKFKASRKETEPAIFFCIGKLSIAVGPALTKHLSRDILDMIFTNCSLSEALELVLHTLTTNIPSLTPTINQKLLNLLSLVLSGKGFQPPGSPYGGGLQMNEQVARDYRLIMIARDTGNSVSSIVSNRNSYLKLDNHIIVQALKMLARFEFGGVHLYEFIQKVAIIYLSYASPRVRREAVITSTKIFAAEPIVHQTSINSLNIVNEVLDKLLTVAVTDPVAEIRKEGLESLVEARSFDPQLSQVSSVRLLNIALHDEEFAVRKVAITLLGRLSQINPASIVPNLRKTLIQLLTRLQFPSTNRKKEEAAVLLGLLIEHSHDLTRPYATPIVDVLIAKAQDASASVAASALACIGELAVVAGEDLLHYVDRILPIMIDTFYDHSNTHKRDASLKALGQLASSTGYVIEPFLQYPQLLGLLVGILKSEASQAVVRETVRLLGILGALDPYKHRESEQHSTQKKIELDQSSSTPVDTALLMAGTSPSSDETFYPTVVITMLMKILRDPSLSQYHFQVVVAIMFIFRNLGVKCVGYLERVVPGMVAAMRTCQPSMLKVYFQHLTELVAIVKHHIRPYLGDMFAVVKQNFGGVHLTTQPNLQVTIITLVESIARALEGEFKPFVSDILGPFLEVLSEDKSVNHAPSLHVLRAVVVFGTNIDEYVHIVIPSVVKLIKGDSVVLCKAAIETIGRLSKSVNLQDMASYIIHPLLRVLDGTSPCVVLASPTSQDEVKVTTITTLSYLLLQPGSKIAVFIPNIRHVMVEQKIHAPKFDQLMHKLVSGDPLPPHLDLYKDYDNHTGDGYDASEPSKKLPVKQDVLRQAWETHSRKSKEDWQDWIRGLSLELLKQSPSHAVRACAPLAAEYYPLAKELFNTSFTSCWNELYSQHQEELVQSFCIALSSPNNPPEIHQTLLNLAEFLEHDDKSLPIAISTLGQYAQRCHAYAKALHYKELEFYEEPSTPTIESLIAINNQLQQSDAAVGILKHAQLHHDLQLKETWYEKLHRWDDALAAYSAREKLEPDNIDIVLGKMRCLHALGEWEQLSELAKARWDDAYPSDIKRSMAPLAAAAAWGLGQWDRMDVCIAVMKRESPDRAFFNAILSLHRNNFEAAQTHIIRARDLLVTEITALVSESYARAYGVMVRVQMLSELEEIIAYKTLPQSVEGHDKRAAMRKTWNRRLLGCQRHVDIWQRMLKVRALVIKPKQDMEMWIKFANLCRKSGRLNLAEKSLNMLLDTGTADNPSRAPPQVVYAQLKYMWAKGQQREALRHLVDFTTRMSQDLGLNPNDLITQPLPQQGRGIPSKKHVEEYTRLLARCFLKQGEWQIALNSSWRTETSEIILGAYLLATHFDDRWYKAWHNWALANFEVISLYAGTSPGFSGNEDPGDKNDKDAESKTMPTPSSVPIDVVQRHVVPSIRGFFHSISLSGAARSSLQDILRLLTLWFKYGGQSDAAAAMAEGFSMVSIDTWLEVVPQLISQIHQPNPVVSRSLFGLLSDLGKAHPQALVYPLAVAVTSDSASRKQAAESIVDKMKLHSANLVEQAELVAHELIRVAVLWHEQWYEGLEDASRLFFGDHNTDKMFEVLEPLHQMMARGAETSREAAFASIYGRELGDAYEWVLNFRRTKDITNLNQAWDIYYNVFRRINRSLPSIQQLELQYVSPKLEQARNFDLAVPGTYRAGRPIIRIAKFDPVLSVISSKQRPRDLSCQGSDGNAYRYVLKGHEDIRQDNLVMQLFGLVNTLLANDPECFKRHLDIQKYPAIPLSPKVGLLGWVPNSDTFHVLIREYRESRKIFLNIEHRIMLQMAPDYDSLTLLQKVEVFTGALDNTRGQDLYKVLWLKSKSSESWLDRRTTYTRSLAVMSMVGYILGLGDRHPSNLMLDRITGMVVHIDFGDCFEAAILREKYPEKVPFRLTRMLNYAMEVSGIEGSFRITCEQVMRVLRDNKESLMAILEAFAYDPLINWGFDFPTKAVAEASGIRVPQINVSDLLRRGQIDDTEAASLTKKNEHELRNARALLVLKRIADKLTGNDIKRLKELDVPTQVNKLIQQATSVENLCQHYIGWCSFW
ncbi:serine/threonine-protein kinase Tor2p [Diutina catenulata]